MPMLAITIRIFQSTRPVWGATPVDKIMVADVDISIHAPRVGRDLLAQEYDTKNGNFNPRAPCGARLRPIKPGELSKEISIHAPRVGRDGNIVKSTGIGALFQSTRPVWGATLGAVASVVSSLFQSTRPVWGATRASSSGVSFSRFQSTRPVWGATLTLDNLHDVLINFNPRAPCGARQWIWELWLWLLTISIHAPRVGRDWPWP